MSDSIRTVCETKFKVKDGVTVEWTLTTSKNSRGNLETYVSEAIHHDGFLLHSITFRGRVPLEERIEKDEAGSLMVTFVSEPCKVATAKKKNDQHALGIPFLNDLAKRRSEAFAKNPDLLKEATRRG